MGEAKNWRKAFFADHPICCFCGGTAPIEVIDHQPARVFFHKRQWPEGFVFPACVRCNRAARLAEDAVSLLTSYFDDERGRKDFRARRDSIWINHPEIIDSLRMTSNEKRRASQVIGVDPRAGGTYSELLSPKSIPQSGCLTLG